MKGLILALVPIIFVTVGYLLGRWQARTKPEITRSERKALTAAQDALDDLAVMASEHSTLGDPFATLALDRITQYRKADR